jgi:hypothetical protein
MITKASAGYCTVSRWKAYRFPNAFVQVVVLGIDQVAGDAFRWVPALWDY